MIPIRYLSTFLSCSEPSRSVDLTMTISLSLTSCSRTATLVVSWWINFSFSWYSPSREEFCFLKLCSSCLTRRCSSSKVESLDFSSLIVDSDLYFLSVKSYQIKDMATWSIHEMFSSRFCHLQVFANCNQIYVSLITRNNRLNKTFDLLHKCIVA